LLSPYLPLLFMGEEYGDPAPFLYFTSHNDPGLAEAVRKGRKEEFAAFAWKGDLPDPQSESTFLRAKLDHRLPDQQPHSALWEFYKELIRLRKTLRPLRNLNKDACRVSVFETGLSMRRWSQSEEILALFNFGNDATLCADGFPSGEWQKLFDSADLQWLGPGTTAPQAVSGKDFHLTLQPKSFCLFGRI